MPLCQLCWGGRTQVLCVCAGAAGAGFDPAWGATVVPAPSSQNSRVPQPCPPKTLSRSPIPIPGGGLSPNNQVSAKNWQDPSNSPWQRADQWEGRKLFTGRSVAVATREAFRSSYLTAAPGRRQITAARRAGPGTAGTATGGGIAHPPPSQGRGFVGFFFPFFFSCPFFFRLLFFLFQKLLALS